MAEERPAKRPRRRRARIVALTGVHGAIGSSLLRRLEDDDRVARIVLIDRFAPALPLRKVIFRGIDLTANLADVMVADVLARERVDTLIHAAFHASPVRDAEAAHELAVIGTQALFRGAADNARHAGTVSGVVVLGSTMSYGAFPDNAQYLREDAPLRGASSYPFVADHVAVEAEAALLRRRTGLPVAVLRASWTLGHEGTLAARLLALPAVPAVLGSDPLVQLVHLDDLIDAVRLAVHGRADGAFNIAGEDVLPLSTMVKLAGRVRAAWPEMALRATLHALWALGVGVVPAAHVAYLHHTFVADPRRAASELGFCPRYTIRDTLARHVAARHGSLRSAA